MEPDSEDKPIIDLAVPTEQEQDSKAHPHDSAEEDVKKKKPSEIDDDDDDDNEPPPPYSENDPIEDDKSDIEGNDSLGTQQTVTVRNSGSGCVPPQYTDFYAMATTQQIQGTLILNSTIYGAPISSMNSGEGHMTSQLPQQQYKSSVHSHHNSQMPVNDGEHPALNKEFPNEDGYLFDIWVKKGQLGGLGLNITASTTSQALQGIAIQQAEENGEMKWGDVILKVNDTCVIEMSQTQVQELLANATLNVKFMLLRQGTTGQGEEVNNKIDRAKQVQEVHNLLLCVD